MPDYSKIAEDITNNLNCFGFDYEKFCVAMSREHRTLQQSFTRMCFEWIKHCASEDYPFDERNCATHVKCKAVVDSMSKDPAWDHFPFI